MKMLVFFLAKCVRTAAKPLVVDRKKKQKALALLYLASKPLRSQAVFRPSSEQNRQGKCGLFAWTLSPNFFRLNWTFCLPPKRQLSILLNFFSINKSVFDFCCLCLFCYNAGHRAISRRKHGIQHRVLSSVRYATSYWWPCGAEGRTDGHVTITSLPKFLGLIGYQICITMVLRWRASARAPL